MFTVGPPKPEPKCPLGRVNVLSSGSTPVGSMLLREVACGELLCTVRCGAQGGGTVPMKSTTSSATSVIMVAGGVLGTPSGPGASSTRPLGKTVEGNWLGELLHPRREGSTTVVLRGLVGDEWRWSRAACWDTSMSSNRSNRIVCVFVRCDRFALRSMMEFVAEVGCAPIVLLTSSRMVCAITSNR